MTYNLKIFFLIVLICLPDYSIAELKIGLLVYPPYAESKEVGGGFIVDLISSLELDGVRLIYFPSARAFHSFFANEVDMVLTSDIAMSDQILKNP